MLRAVGRCHLLVLALNGSSRLGDVFSQFDMFYLSSFIASDDKCSPDASVMDLRWMHVTVTYLWWTCQEYRNPSCLLGKLLSAGVWVDELTQLIQRSCRLYVWFVDKLIQSPGVAELKPVSIYLRHVIQLAEDSEHELGAALCSALVKSSQVLGRILFHC